MKNPENILSRRLVGGEDKKLIFNEPRRRRKNIHLYLNIETAITHKLKIKTSQSVFNCSKLTRETPEQGVKYAES